MKSGVPESGAKLQHLADNEWLSDNHDKTVHAIERLSVATVPMRYLLRTRVNSTHPHSLLKAAKP